MRQYSTTPLRDNFKQWCQDNLKSIENASQIDVVTNVKPSGNALLSLNNASANQVPLYTGATTVTFLTISPFWQAVLGTSGGTTSTQRSVTATPIVVAPTDQMLNCRITSAASCALPLASSRAGLAVTFKDLGQAGSHNITLTPHAGDTIDGSASAYVIRTNYQWVTLVPFNDGVNVGWMIQ